MHDLISVPVSTLETPSTDTPLEERLLTRGEVAAMFRVDPRTVTRWTGSGRLQATHTPGGAPRYRETYIRELVASTTPSSEPAEGRRQ